MLFSLLLAAGLQMAAAPDTLQAVTVVADRGMVVSRTDTVSLSPHQDAGSVLLRIPALYVGDYGSAAGLKSAGLRGFGSAHTAIYLDGVRVKNLQSGQADLGMLDFNDLSRVVADYAQNSLSFQTARPVFDRKAVTGSVRLSGGSFGSWQPYVKLAVKLNEHWSLSAHAGGLITQGNFLLPTGTFRINNDLKQFQAGADLFGTVKGGDFHAKIYYNGAERGTPGSLDWPSSDRQADRNFGAQAVLKKAFSPLYTLHLSGKFAHDKLLYLSEWGNTEYKQVEFQLNSAHTFHLKPWWDVSLAADASLDALPLVYNHYRVGLLFAAATAFHTERVKASLTLEYAFDADSFARGGSWDRLSPSADIRVTLTEGLDVVAFGRRAFRAPTFNELYYPGFGNALLKPEDAWLADMGLDWHRKMGAWTLKARADAFYHSLTNKIVSAPTVEDPSVWLPYNVGKAQALGTDVLASLGYDNGTWKSGFSVHYGWQKATDKSTDQPLPYVAAHSLVLCFDAGWKGWTLETVWNLRAGRKDAAGDMPDWNTLDGSVGKVFNLGRAAAIALTLSGRNLLNYRYETISGYPMPGRSFMAGISYRF